MKRDFTLLLFTILSQFVLLNVEAQISITAEDLPFPGLEVATATEILPEISVGEASDKAQIWNYTNLNSLATQSVSFNVIEDDSVANVHYPNASMKNNLLSVLGGGGDVFPIDIGGATTYYSQDSQGNVEIDGVFIDLGLDSLGFEEINMAGDPADDFYAVGTHGDSFDSSSSYSFSFNVEVDTVPIPIPILISISSDRDTKIDAFGTMQFSYGQFDVLRYNEANDVNIAAGIPNPFGGGFITTFIDTSFQTSSYRFYTKDKGYPLASVTMGEDDSGVFAASIEYQAQQAPDPVGFSYVVTCLNVAFTNTSSEAAAQGGPIQSSFWDFGDGNTSDLKDAVHNYEVMGIYEVKLQVQRQNGAVDSISQVIEVGCTDVNIEDLPTVYHTIYPNPAREVLNFSFEPDALLNVEQIYIYNAMGQQIFVVDSLSDIVELDVSQWANGVYFYALHSVEQGRLLGDRFIVQH